MQSIMKEIAKSIPRVTMTILMLFLTSCYYDSIVEEQIPPDEIVSFSLDIQPIFTNNCIECHPVIEAVPDLTEGNSYNSITNGIYIVPDSLDTSLLYQRLLGNPTIMPPSGALPFSDISLFKRWIEQGAQNN